MLDYVKTTRFSERLPTETCQWILKNKSDLNVSGQYVLNFSYTLIGEKSKNNSFKNVQLRRNKWCYKWQGFKEIKYFI